MTPSERSHRLPGGRGRRRRSHRRRRRRGDLRRALVRRQQDGRAASHRQQTPSPHRAGSGLSVAVDLPTRAARASSRSAPLRGRARASSTTRTATSSRIDHVVSGASSVSVKLLERQDVRRAVSSGPIASTDLAVLEGRRARVRALSAHARRLGQARRRRQRRRDRQPVRARRKRSRPESSAHSTAR